MYILCFFAAGSATLVAAIATIILLMALVPLRASMQKSKHEA